MVTDHIDDRGVCAARIVQVRQSVGQARTQVQQGGRRSFGHAAIAVCGTGHHPLEKGQYSTHLGHRVEACHEVHLRRAWVGEADVHPAAHQCTDQGLRTIHGIALEFIS
jgi:hypothetical protein